MRVDINRAAGREADRADKREPDAAGHSVAVSGVGPPVRPSKRRFSPPIVSAALYSVKKPAKPAKSQVSS